MKGFSEPAEGPIGPWYQKVNEVVERAQQARTVQELVAILGDPDEVEALTDDERRVGDSTSPIDLRHPAKIFEYADPYRRGRFYRFDVSESGAVLGMTRLSRKGQR
ncbi:MAG: hypothetical protein ABL960_00075 [Nitrospira sp.]